MSDTFGENRSGLDVGMPTRTRQGRNQVSLARALSKLGVTSRTQAIHLIHDGRVKVNGVVVRSPHVWVDPKSETISINGAVVRSTQRLYLAFHKPSGVVTTHSDELGRTTVYDYLPRDLPWLFPVGRLDKETSGLLLLTNDTRFGERVTNPLEQVPKTYEVELERALADNDRRVLEAPMRLHDGTVLKPAIVRRLAGHNHRYEVTITEGKNRQLHRMFEHVGYTVRALKRVRIGPIRLGDLKEGEFRSLTEKERALL